MNFLPAVIGTNPRWITFYMISFCVYECLPTCRTAHGVQKKVSGPPTSSTTDSCKPPSGCWESSRSALEEKPETWTILQSPVCSVNVLKEKKPKQNPKTSTCYDVVLRDEHIALYLGLIWAQKSEFCTSALFFLSSLPVCRSWFIGLAVICPLCVPLWYPAVPSFTCFSLYLLNSIENRKCEGNEGLIAEVLKVLQSEMFSSIAKAE